MERDLSAKAMRRVADDKNSDFFEVTINIFNSAKAGDYETTIQRHISEHTANYLLDNGYDLSYSDGNTTIKW